MSVIVKDMRLPDCCAECELSESDDEGIYCNVLEVFMRFDELPKGRRSDCPIFDENVETIQSIVLVGRNGNVAEYTKVIRCKDCKYYQQGGNADEWLWCMMNHHYTDEEKYCAWAEPKETK